MKTLLKQPHLFDAKARTMVRIAVGLATGMLGIADMLFLIVPRLHWDILLGVWTIDGLHGAQKLTVVVGFFLVMLSSGLLRGKVQAWRITLALLTLSCFLHILRGGSKLATLVALALTSVLLGLYRFIPFRQPE